MSATTWIHDSRDRPLYGAVLKERTQAVFQVRPT